MLINMPPDFPVVAVNREDTSFTAVSALSSHFPSGSTTPNVLKIASHGAMRMKRPRGVGDGLDIPSNHARSILLLLSPPLGANS